MFFFTIFLFLIIPFFSSQVEALSISPHGYWKGVEAKDDCFDESLSEDLIKFYRSENAYTLVDFGCGIGSYVKDLIENGFE